MDYLYKIYGWRYVGGIEMVAKTPYKDKAYSIANNLNPEDYVQYMIIEHDNKNDIDCPIARQTLHKTQGRVIKRWLNVSVVYQDNVRARF